MTADRNTDPRAVANFNEHRAEREQNSKLWTPRDAAEKLLRDIVEGRRNPTLMYVCLSESLPDGTEQMYHYCAGGKTLEYAGLLTVSLHDLARDVE